jgi:adenylate kinase
VNILVLGPQGSGKGTQAKKVSRTYGIPHVSSGDLYREAIARGTKLGKQVEPILAAGRLVPDDITIPLIRDRLDRGDTIPGFILDGYPRNLAQAEALDAMLREIGRGLDAVIVLEVPDAVARERMLERARKDDTPDVIENRLATYHEQTAPLVDWYRARDKVVPVDGTESIDAVWTQIRTALERLAEAA